MAELTEEEIDAALDRGQAARAVEPRVVEARFDRSGGRMVVELSNGCTFLFPPRSLQGLETASDDEIAAVEILGCGSGLHWDAGGADYSIAGLLAGRFGTKSYMDVRMRKMDGPDAREPVLEAG